MFGYRVLKNQKNQFFNFILLDNKTKMSKKVKDKIFRETKTEKFPSDMKVFKIITDIQKKIKLNFTPYTGNRKRGKVEFIEVKNKDDNNNLGMIQYTRDITFPIMLNFMDQILKIMCYIHVKTDLIHGDFQDHNILYTDNLNLLIKDWEYSDIIFLGKFSILDDIFLHIIDVYEVFNVFNSILEMIEMESIKEQHVDKYNKIKNYVNNIMHLLEKFKSEELNENIIQKHKLVTNLLKRNKIKTIEEYKNFVYKIYIHLYNIMRL